MDFKIRKIGGAVLAAALVSTFVITGCGGGGGNSGGGGTPAPTSSNLKAALYSILSAAPVVSNTLQRQTGTGIAAANVSYVSDLTGVAGFGAARITAATAPTDVNGTASMAVPAGNYTARLSALPVDLVTGENAAYYSTETVSTSGGKTYMADQYSVAITAPFPISAVEVTVYQTDSAGTVDWGSFTNTVNPLTGTVAPAIRNPIVFSKITPIAGTVTTTTTENIELFKGYYKIVVRATPVTATNALAPHISSVISVAGGGNTVSNPITLAAPSKSPTITLNDAAGAAITTGYTVDFYDSTSNILLGSAVTDVNGTASVGAASVTTGVVAAIYAPTTLAYSGVYVFSNINTSAAAILQQYTVAGQLVPTAGTLDTIAIPTVYALASTGLGRLYDGQVATTTATAGTGIYTLTLFGNATTPLSYKLAASGVTNFPDVTKLSVAVNGALTGKNIAVAPGGVLMGRIQTEGKVDLAGVTVSVYGTAADGIIDLVNTQLTDVAGNYSIQVPYGTYFLMVNGAVTDGISVSAGSSTVQKNLTRFSLNGQVSKNIGAGTTQGASLAKVYAGAQLATAGALGTYTINVMEGKNWICASPSPVNDPTYGYTCTMNVLVDAASVAAARM